MAKSTAPEPAAPSTARPRSGRTDNRNRAPSLDAILDVAAQMFEEQGYQSVTMQDLADRIGIAKPTLYVHAKSKVAILEAIFEKVTRGAEAATEAALAVPVPAERLRELLYRWTLMAVQIQKYYNVYWVHHRDLPAPSARYYERWSAEIFEKIRKMVADGQRSGAIRSDLDPAVITFSIVSLPNWTARWYVPGGQLTPEAIAAQQWLMVSGGVIV